VSVRDFKSTVDGEWAIENGDFATISDADAVPQGIRIRLGMFLGECYLDESVGVDYIDSINIKNADPLVVRGLLSAAIAETPDVTNVVGAQVVQTAEREASVEYQVDTVYSVEPISGQTGVP
jgi:hypothetical protein